MPCVLRHFASNDVTPDASRVTSRHFTLVRDELTQSILPCVNVTLDASGTNDTPRVKHACFKEWQRPSNNNNNNNNSNCLQTKRVWSFIPFVPKDDNVSPLLWYKRSMLFVQSRSFSKIRFSIALVTLSCYGFSSVLVLSP